MRFKYTAKNIFPKCVAIFTSPTIQFFRVVPQLFILSERSLHLEMHGAVMFVGSSLHPSDSLLTWMFFCSSTPSCYCLLKLDKMPYFQFKHNTGSQVMLWPIISPRDFLTFSQETFIIAQSQTMWKKVPTKTKPSDVDSIYKGIYLPRMIPVFIFKSVISIVAMYFPNTSTCTGA